MAKLGTNSKPAILRVQTEERAQEIYALCAQKGLKVIIGIEPDKHENISDLDKALYPAGNKPLLLKIPTSKNATCPCGSGKQYKRCCMD